MTSPDPNPGTPESRRVGNIVTWIALGCGGLLVLGVGLMTALFLVAQRSLNMSFDADQAEAEVGQIVDYTMPGESRGFISMTVSGMQMAGVISTPDPQEAVLMVGKVPPALAQASPEQMQDIFEQNIERQRGANVRVTARRTETRVLCEQPVSVAIIEGEQLASTGMLPSVTYQGLAAHQGSIIFVSLTTTGADALAKANQIFDSLVCK